MSETPTVGSYVVSSEDYRRDTLSVWVDPTCWWRGETPAPVVHPDDTVTMCTATLEWTVADIAQDGLVVLAPTDQTHRTHVAHVAHLDIVRQAPRPDDGVATADTPAEPDTPSMLDLLGGDA